jgi:hypothetical protein
MSSGSTANLNRHLNCHKDKIDRGVNKQATMMKNFLKSGGNSEHIVCIVYVNQLVYIYIGNFQFIN